MISNRKGEKVLVEGFLGELEEMSFVEGAMLELRGSNGVLRMDLKEEELEKLFSRLAHGNVKREGEHLSYRWPRKRRQKGE
jgi:hypothetical protein